MRRGVRATSQEACDPEGRCGGGKGGFLACGIARPVRVGRHGVRLLYSAMQRRTVVGLALRGEPLRC
eukprot:4045023-Lingulodinium_polyedra.AAC.1